MSSSLAEVSPWPGIYVSEQQRFWHDCTDSPEPLLFAYALTLVMLNNKDATPTSNFQPIRLIDLSCSYKFKHLKTNNADPDQLASLEAN